jgi:hypothetical protein
MPSTISAGTTGGTAIAIAGDTSGELQLRTNGTTPALTLSTAQNASFAGSVSASNTFGFENRIINGNMRIDQRNAGSPVTVTTGVAYTLDRWIVEDGCDAVLSVQQSTDAPNNSGFVNSLRVTATTADSSIGATQYCVITQIIEGFNTSDLMWGTGNAKTVTASFWVKASVAGQYSCTVYNETAARINPQAFTINSANTWEYKTIIITGDTIGTWLTNNGRGIIFNIYIALGSTYLGSAGWNSSNIYGVTGQANALASTNNTFLLTGVQLEKGTQATSFDFRSIGQELALCQRYYDTITMYVIGSGDARQVFYKTTMRANPTYAGGGSGFAAINQTTNGASVAQTTAASQTLTMSSEL